MLKQRIILFLKGMAMGAADIVPGVSGGTIAFISGIYEELIDSIRSFNLVNIKLLFKKGGISEFWKAVNGAFLLTLFLGILTSVLSVARVLKYTLDTYPVLLWSFFFGLIIASAIMVARKIHNWNIYKVIVTVIAAAVAVWVTSVSPTNTSDSYFFLFITGAIAICAMILPGISGAFILLLLGKYQTVLEAINPNNPNISVILLIGAGAVVGLLSFSNILGWLLKKYHDITIAALFGFMIGSLNKIWPWKETLEWITGSHGKQIPYIENNILPNHWEVVNNQPSQVGYAVMFMVVGFLVIFVIEYIAKKIAK